MLLKNHYAFFFLKNNAVVTKSHGPMSVFLIPDPESMFPWTGQAGLNWISLQFAFLFCSGYTATIMSAHDVNEQTGMDMLKARRSTTLALNTIRSFLHSMLTGSLRGYWLTIAKLDGEDQWETRRKVTQILEGDAVFDKARRWFTRSLPLDLWISNNLTNRDFMSRTERYTRGIALTNRVYQLQELHSWTQHETSIAIATLDEQLPISLHNVGLLVSLHIIYINLLRDLQPSNLSLCFKHPLLFWRNILILLPRKAFWDVICKLNSDMVPMYRD